ncbi:MAG: FixH family protein [Phycisphaerae bacterium]|jgi:nitrogen fixation protein FixH
MSVVQDKIQLEKQAPARSWLWPGLVIGLIVMQAALAGTLIVCATNDPSFAVEPDYYRRALNWDAEAAQRRASDSLGWTLSLEVAPAANVVGEREVRFRLRDHAGAPINDAHLDVTVFHHARGNERIGLMPAEKGGGEYICAAPLRKAGTWEFRVRALRGMDQFVATELVEVEPSRGKAP